LPGALERWAAAAPVVARRREVSYKELPCRSVLNRCANPRLPFGWTINPYRGCELGCTYCYARYTHEYLGEQGWLDFEKTIYVKSQAAQRLAAEARGGRLRGRSIALGTATDPYQPAERRFGVTRSILEVLAGQDGLRLSITTKSDLVTRDLDLLRQIGARGRLHVNFSITTLWPALARRLEPRAPTPLKRLMALRRLAGAGIECGVFLMPILPGLTDDDANLASVASAAAECGARYLVGQALFLRPSARRLFLPFLELERPALAAAYRRAFAAGTRLGPAYRRSLSRRLALVRSRYGLADGPSPDPGPPGGAAAGAAQTAFAW
jgi:DNA repair photolyase